MDDRFLIPESLWFRLKCQEVKQATNCYKRPGIKSEEGKNKDIKR